MEHREDLIRMLRNAVTIGGVDGYAGELLMDAADLLTEQANAELMEQCDREKLVVVTVQRDELLAALKQINALPSELAGEAWTIARHAIANSGRHIVSPDPDDPDYCRCGYHGTHSEHITEPATEYRTVVDLKPIPADWVEAANNARGLCESEANRWEQINPKTAEHWRSVATRLGALYLSQDHIGVRK